MTLLQRFSIICLAVFVIFGYALNLIIAHELERFMIRESIESTAAFVVEEVGHEFRASDFSTPKFGREYDLFSERVRHLTFGKNVERIKLWGTDGTVLWSDNRDIVGLKFSDNRDFAAAAAGKTVSDVSSLKKLENMAEKSHGRLIELYVPVTFAADTGVGAVIEVYQNIGHLIRTIEQQKRLTWQSIAIGLSSLYLALFGIVWRASRRIDRQGREILRSRERYISLIMSAHDGIISVDREGRVLLANIAAERIFDAASDSLLGLSARELVIPADHSRFSSAMEVCISGRTDKGCGVPFEATGQRLDGSRFPVEISLTASGSDEDLLVTGFFRDISERKAMQEQLIASEKAATISVIAGSIGHEVKNILSSLLGYSELLLMRKDNDELTAQCAEIFSSQTQRLNLHANNLLTLGKPQEPEMKDMPIHAFLDKVTDLLAASGLLRHCTVVKKYSSEEIVINGDEMLLEQVIRNLEINALHAMEKQGILTISTGITEDNRYAEIAIADTGHGIKDSLRHQIFLPFYTTKEKGKGTGLGLYIVKQIIDQHRGFINIESEEGRGTTVLIGLPLHTPESDR